MFFSALQVAKKRSDVVWIMSDIIFPVSYVVFPTSNIIFAAFVKWQPHYALRRLRGRIPRAPCAAAPAASRRAAGMPRC